MRGDLAMLREIERAAGRCFRDVGMPEIADDEPLPLNELERYRRSGWAWVAADAAHRPVAYLIAVCVEVTQGAGAAVHVEQVSVHPDYGHRRIGRALLEQVAQEASLVGVSTLSLTTFAQVPWNAPYYRRCGFHVVDEPDWTPFLRAVRAQEAAHGLDRWPRVCMARPLP